jgi:hypothetical protein
LFENIPSGNPARVPFSLLIASSRFVLSAKGCQIFLATKYQIGGEMYQITTKLPNDYTIYQIDVIHMFQMGIKYTNIFHSKGLPKCTKIGIFVLKRNHLATLSQHQMASHFSFNARWATSALFTFDAQLILKILNFIPSDKNSVYEVL